MLPPVSQFCDVDSINNHIKYYNPSCDLLSPTLSGHLHFDDTVTCLIHFYGRPNA